jgi:hypothetical protein
MTLLNPIFLFSLYLKTIEKITPLKLQNCCISKSKIMPGKVEDKQGYPIEAGDTVYTKIRGGKREGQVTFPVHHKLGFQLLNLCRLTK